MAWFGFLKPYKYTIVLHKIDYSFTKKENWKECVSWCEKTFDKNNYTCDINMDGNEVIKVIVRFKLKEDFTQFILAWCE